MVVGERHLRAAMERVGASVLRGHGVERPSLSFDSIGGQPEAKKRLRQAVLYPSLYPSLMQRFRLTGQGGLLLCGPPGSGKTSLVKAAAASLPGLSFLPFSASDIYSVYVGEAEAAVRRAFALARQAAPCLLFFDELDALLGGSAGETRGGGGNTAEARVLSTFLNELDGVDVAAGHEGVLVVGATNMPESLDPALLRPGRLSYVIRVLPPQDAQERKAILRVHTRKMPLAAYTEEEEDELLAQAAEATESFSGAELEGLCREAALACLREEEDECYQKNTDGQGQEEAEKERTGRIGWRHFEAAMRRRR